jgi:hypothetical protein
MKKYPFLLLLFSLSFIKIYSQCAYTGTPLSQVGSAYTFCIDNTNTFTTPSVRSGQFVVVNVVKGFRYTFSVGNVFTAIGQNENLTILDASTNSNVSPATFASGVSGAAISNWTASLTGQIKILLSRSTCINDNTVGGALTLTLNAVGNTQDSESTFGINQWVGHVYNYAGGAAPGGASPSSPSVGTPFLASNYVGYYNIQNESITENFGGNTACFPLLSNGLTTVNMYSESFAVRYRMQSTRTPGCYFLNVRGDDGVRVYVDNVLVFNAWRDQAPANFCNNLIYLNGSSNIVLDFYENAGQNEVSFSLTPFVPSSNLISGPSIINLCSGVSPGLLNASAYLPCNTSSISNVLFQWQVSSDNSVFTNISGATSEDYTPPAITTTTNNVRYYRRVLKSSASNANACEFVSNTITINTSPSGPLTISGPISGLAAQCASSTNQVYNVNPVPNALNYNWTVPTGWTITAGQGTNSIQVSAGIVGQNGVISVTASNACVSSIPTNLSVTVNPLPTASISGNNGPICSGANATFTLTGTSGAVVTYTINGGSNTTATLTGGTATVTVTGASSNQTLNLVSINNPSTSCNQSLSGSSTVTVNPLPTASISGNNGPAVCSGSDITFTLTGTSAAVVTYNLNGGSNTTVTLTGGSATVTVTAATATQTLNLVSVTNGTCPATLSASSTVVIESTTWNGTSWSNGTPTSTKAVNFTGNYTIGANFDACSISVSNNAVVSVTSGFNVNLSNTITVASGSSFTLNNNANLFQSNVSAVNTGNIIIRRQTNPLIRLDYTLWSSPVTGQGLYAFSPFTFANRFYVYNTSSNLYTTSTLGLNVTGTNAAGVNGIDQNNVQFATGKGYLIRLPYNHPTAPIIFNGSFTGVPNNGTKTITLTNVSATQQFNAVGNPYPSPIDIAKFATDNLANIEPTLYFWRKTNNTASPSYCTWNTTSSLFGDNGEAYTNTPNGVIQTGQGFLVEAKDGAASLEFNNGQRVANNANQFFRANTEAAPTSQADVIWLNLTGTGAEFSQAVVSYFANATLGADAYDSKYFNDGAVALNMLIGSTEYVIQGRPTFQATDIVPLNYKVTTVGTYTFAIDHVDGLFTGGAQAIYIKDNQDGSYHNLSSPYTFTSAAGTFANRFELVYQTALTTNDNNFTANSINVIKQQNGVVVRTSGTTMQEVTIYDIKGSVLVTKTNINASETKINVGTTNQVLLVQVTTVDGFKATKKVVN